MILSNPKSAIMALLLSVATRPGITAAERKLNLRNGSSRSRALSPDQEADEPVLGSSNQENPQAIVGGELVTQGDYPYFGSILEFEGGWVTFCGGALIAPDIVLTAAHCTDDIDLDLTKVYFNSTTFNSGLERTFSQCTRHPEYGVAVSLDYDYALCKLDQPVTTIQPIEIDNGETDLNENTEFLIMGHGKIEFGGAMSWDLLDTTVQYIDNTDCGVLYDTEITDAMICAGIPDVGGQDSCQGDSGGPMVLRKFNFDGTHKDVHVGVVSWGTGCAEAEHPGVYARRFRGSWCCIGRIIQGTHVVLAWSSGNGWNRNDCREPFLVEEFWTSPTTYYTRIISTVNTSFIYNILFHKIVKHFPIYIIFN